MASFWSRFRKGSGDGNQNSTRSGLRANRGSILSLFGSLKLQDTDPNHDDILDEESHYPLFDPNNPDHCPPVVPETPPKRTLTPYPRRFSESNLVDSPSQQGYVGRLASFIRSGASVFHVNTQEQEGKVIPSPESARSLRSILSRKLRHASSEQPPEQVALPRSSPIAVQPPQLDLDLPTTPLVMDFDRSYQNVIPPANQNAFHVRNSGFFYPSDPDAFHDIFYDRPMGPKPVSHAVPLHGRQASTATLGGNMSEDRGYLSGEESNADADGFDQVEISRAITYPPRSRYSIGETISRHKSEGTAKAGSEPTPVDVENIKIPRRRPSIQRTVSLRKGLSDLNINRLNQGSHVSGGRPGRIPSTAYEADSEAEDSEPTMGPRKVWEDSYRMIRDKKYQEMMESEIAGEGTTSGEDVQMGQGGTNATGTHHRNHIFIEGIPAPSHAVLSGGYKHTEALRFEIEAIERRSGFELDGGSQHQETHQSIPEHKLTEAFRLKIEAINRKSGVELDQSSEDEDTLRKPSSGIDSLPLLTSYIPPNDTETPFCAARLPLFNQNDEFDTFRLPLLTLEASKVVVASRGLGPADDGLHRAIQRVREAYDQNRAQSGRLGSSGSDYAISISNSSRASSGGYPISMSGHVSVNDMDISSFTYGYPDGFERPRVSFADVGVFRLRRNLQRSTETNAIELGRRLDLAEKDGSWETTRTSLRNVSLNSDDKGVATRARLDGSKDSHISLALDSFSVFGDVSARHVAEVKEAEALLSGRLARRRVERRMSLLAKRQLRTRPRVGEWACGGVESGDGELRRLGRVRSSRSVSLKLLGGSGSTREGARRSWMRSSESAISVEHVE